MSLSPPKWALLVLASAWILAPRTAMAQSPRFSVGAAIPIAAGDAGPQGVAIADLNKDERLDIVVVATAEVAGPIAILINQGAGAFAAPRFVSDEDGVLGDPIAVAVADVGAVSGGPDQNNDIIVVDADGGYLILFGDGAGNFVIEGDVNEVEGLDAPVGVAVGDFDGQNGPDLAIVDTDGPDNNGEVFFLCNIGQAGVFEPCGTLALDSGGEEPIDMGAGDFNGDGQVDIVVLNQGTAEGEGNVGLFIGNGAGTFAIADQPTFPVDLEPRDLAVANLNPAEDSIDDIVVAEFESSGLGLDNLSIFLGSTTGAILREQDKATLDLYTTVLAVGNFFADDSLDIAGTSDPDEVSSFITVISGNGTGAFSQQPQSGGALNGGAVSIVAGRLNDDTLDDLVVLNLAATELRIALNISASATETPGTGSPTVAPTPTPTRNVTPELKGCTVEISSGSVDPVALAKGDFDRDGNPDLAVVDGTGGQVIVLLTDLDQLRGPKSLCKIPRSDPYSVAGGPQSIVAADLNRDGRLDLAVSTASGVSILLASTAVEGQFENARTVAPGVSVRSVAVDDFDHDGKQDLAVAGSNVVTIRFGAGDGFTFDERGSRPAFSVLGAFIVVAADLNGDGWADLGVVNDTDNRLLVLLQTPASSTVVAGSFPNQPTQANTLMLTGGTPTAMIAATLTANAAPQLIVAMRSTLGGQGTFAVVRRSGNLFSIGPTTATGGRPSALGTGELVPSSGLTDVLVGSSAENSVAFFAGNSDGTFGASSSATSVGRMPSALVTADFDGDGKPDVVVTNLQDGTLTLLLSTNVDPTPTPTFTNIVPPSSTPTITGTPGPSSTPTLGTPGPTETPKPGTFSLSSCSIVPGISFPTGDAGMMLGAAAILWLRRRSMRKRAGR